jgi:hypothetical protein
MEVVSLDGKGGHLGDTPSVCAGVADFDPVGVECGADGKALLGRCRADQLDNRPVTDEGFAAPVLGDEREQAVLDPYLRGDMPSTGAPARRSIRHHPP